MSEAFVHLVANAAILLSLVYLFELVHAASWVRRPWVQRIAMGLVLGLLGLVIMQIPWTLGPGIFFDTRTVLLAISGLFFGTVPTAIAMAMTGAYRLSLGGTGVVMGVGTILSAGVLGLVWRHTYGQHLEQLSMRTLYALGLVVHAVMLALVFTMPLSTALSVLQNITLPVIVIYPAATALLGFIMVDRLRHDRQAAAIAESEGTFRALLEQASVGIAKVDTVTRRYQVVNQRYADILGYPQEELVGNDFVDVTHPEDRTAHEEDMRRMIAGEIPGFTLEKRYLRKDGSTVWVEATVAALWERGKPPSAHMVMIVDTTQRKEAEQALRRSEADLRQAQAVAHVGSWRWDVQEDRLTWSDEMYRIYGVPSNQPVTSWQDIVNHLVHPDDHARVLAANSAVLDRRDIAPLEYRILRPDGTVRIIWDQTGDITTDADGRPVSLVGVAMDITERKQAEQALEALNAQLEERVRERTAQLEAANKELEAFSYSVSHDLRAPLRSIDGFSQAFLEDFGQTVPPEGREDLERVRRATQRMSALIDDMLALSRITRSPMHAEQVDLTALARDVVKELEEQEPGRDVAVEIEEGMSAQGDRALLAIVMQNLLSNAWKFTSRKEHAHIAVGTTVDPQHGPAFFVRDDGAGFDPRYKDKLFVPFQRLHTLEEFPGTGVGLATIQRAVRRHGGETWAEGAVGGGATFYFTIPEPEQVSAKEEA